MKDNEEAFELLVEAIKKAGYKPGDDIALAFDVAASEMYDADTKTYTTKWSNPDKKYTTEEWTNMIDGYINKYPIVSVEDPIDENDWEGWQTFTEKMGDKVQIVGDDLFVTNTDYLKKGIDMGVANSILIKLNQIGTLTETFEAIEMAKEAGYTAVVSHRSGETEDTTIADLVVATNAGEIKTGSMSRTDRIAKYNQLMRIEDQLGAQSQYKGRKSFYNVKAID